MAEPSPEPASTPLAEALLAYRPALMRYFRRRAHPADVDDLVQDVFLSIQARQTATPIENMEGYVFAVAMSALVRKGRRTGVSRRQVAYEEAAESGALVEDLSPERILLGKEGLARAAEIMRGMPARTREVFLLHRFEEMTYPAIAREFGISVSAVEKHIMNALKLLAAGLGRSK